MAIHISSSSPPQPLGSRTYRTLLGGLVFVVLLLLALITLPPMASGRAETLRSHLDTDVQAFNDTLIATEQSMQEMQAATRGYLLTQAPAFLEQYHTARDGLPARLQDLVELAPRVDPAIPAQVTELVAVSQRWQREGSDYQIGLVQSGRSTESISAVAKGESQAMFDSFRGRVTDLQKQTQLIQTGLLLQINRARSLQVALTSGLGVLGLIAVGFVIVGFRSLVMLMRALQDERERAGGLAQAARAERQRLQTVFDHSPEGLIFAEAPDGRIGLANPAAGALLGPIALDSSVRMQRWTQRIFRPGGERCPIDELPLLRTIEAGEPCRGVELTIEQPDGQRVPVLVTSVPLHSDEGVLRGAVAVFQDLRQLREVERLKSDFVALVSHELRTPLTAIQGCVQSLLQRGITDPARTQEFLHIIAEQGDRLQELIDNLLSLSQVEAGALRLRRELVQPQQLIQGVLRQLRERLSGLRVQADIEPNLPFVSADGRRIEQVLFNLLDNARKFAPPGSALTVRAERSGNQITISVSDQGPGVPVAERERVFERFYQLEQTATRNVGGSGLGLAICKAIVEAHGGQISVTDAPGGGACFQFTLLAMSPSEAPAETTSNILVRPRVGATHVLVVDDDPALRRLLESTLPDAGYSVQTVVEAQAALDAVTQQPPDVILLDIMLPGIDGFALCKQLREWTRVPIIMLTARAAENDVVLGLQLGADDYVTKPFRANELIARIEAVVRRASHDAPSDQPALIQIDELSIDLAQRRVQLAGTDIELTPIEYHLLTYLARHAGQVLTHQQILAEVWGEGYSAENHYLWVHIAHLRQKLEPESKQSRYIITERGVGYRMKSARVRSSELPQDTLANSMMR
jgi:DNA-binding response OmpR family regulator/signal transduction histidine kinase/CHASE3 domain sensor protein